MYLGIDIGGTSIKFAVFDDNYKIIHYETCKTPDNVTVNLILVPPISIPKYI